MNKNLSDLSLWSAFGNLKVRQVLSWDLWVSLALSTLGTTAYVRFDKNVESHKDLIENLLGGSGALFGVVLAGFAIAAALLGERYLELIRASGASLLDLLRHFYIVAGILVTAIASCVLFIGAALPLRRWQPVVEEILFGVPLFFFFWGLFGSLQLMKLVLFVSVTSAELSSLATKPRPNTDEEDDQ